MNSNPNRFWQSNDRYSQEVIAAAATLMESQLAEFPFFVVVLPPEQYSMLHPGKSPEDEAKLRPSLTPPKPPPKSLPTSGQHISVQLGQLLEVFNEHRDDIQQVLTRNTPSTKREQLSKKLHAALYTKDPLRWPSETLRGYAVRLIFPTPSDGRRSKKPALYAGDGVPKKLATLLENLANQLQEVMTFETGQWKDWLIEQLRVSEKEASNITTIVRLTRPRRGGRRLPVQPSAEVQQPSQPPTAPH